MPTTDTEEQILKRLQSEGADAAADLFESERDRLQRFVMHRMDPRLQGRLDLDDVMQESQLVVVKRHQDFIQNPAVPFYVWMRSLTGQVLIDLHRRQKLRLVLCARAPRVRNDKRQDDDNRVNSGAHLCRTKSKKE